MFVFQIKICQTIAVFWKRINSHTLFSTIESWNNLTLTRFEINSKVWLEISLILSFLNWQHESKYGGFFLLKWTLKKDVYKFRNNRMPTCCFWKDNRSCTSGSLLLYKNGFPSSHDFLCENFIIAIYQLRAQVEVRQKNFAIYLYLIHIYLYCFTGVEHKNYVEPTQSNLRNSKAKSQ